MSSLTRTRRDQHEEEAYSPKRSRTGHSTSSASSGRSYKPRILYGNHPKSGVGKDFHSVPYPLNGLPIESWRALNQGEEEGAVCARCLKPRKSTPHQRKLFLVAERLSWDLSVTPSSARSQNEIALWAVNAKLDIFDPAVEEDDPVPGGKRSRENPFYPFKAEQEAEFAMRIVAKAEMLTSDSWEVWKAQAEAMLNPPPSNPQTGPGTAAEPLDLTADVAEATSTIGLRQPTENKQQAEAVYKLLQEWSKTDPVLKGVMYGMEQKVTINPHGTQIFNNKVEAAMKAIKGICADSEHDVAKAAKGESPAVLERLTAKARDEPDFRALVMSVSKDVATTQTRSLFKTHVRAARAATSDSRPPLQDISPNSMTQTAKGKEKAAESAAPLAAPRKICSYQTLQDFYGLLDKIERTSPMGAKYLEAYAARLQAESCNDCWFKANVLSELMEDEPEVLPKSEATVSGSLHGAGLAAHHLTQPSMSGPSHAQGYVDRYRAQHGQDPPTYIMQQYAPTVAPRPPVSASFSLTPTIGHASGQPLRGPGPRSPHVARSANAYTSGSHTTTVPQRVQDYISRYQAQYGQYPSQHLIQTAFLSHQNEALSQTNASASHDAHARVAVLPPTLQQQRAQVPADIVFPSSEHLGLPPASQVPRTTHGHPLPTYVSPCPSSSHPHLARKGRR